MELQTRAERFAICVECLRCRHRGVLDATVLQHHGLAADVSIAELSRRLVCEACGSKALKAFRAPVNDAKLFLLT